MNNPAQENERDAIDWQKPLRTAEAEVWDVLVVGAGPAGSFAAMLLAGQGYKVLMVDRELFPREKVCGDCLLEDVLVFLDRADVLTDVRNAAFPISGITAVSPSGYEATIPGRHLTLRRRIFDTILVRRAVDVGVTFCRGDIRTLTNHNGPVIEAVSRESKRTVRSKFVVVATGSQVGLADRLGLVVDRKPSALAMRCYTKADYRLDQIVLAYDRSVIPGYGWVVPLGDGEFNIGCGVYRPDYHRVDLKELFRSFTGQFPLAGMLMTAGKITQPARGGALRCGLRGTHPLFGNRIIIAGETLGSTLQFSGEGVGQAMATAELAAKTIGRALDSGNPSILREYPRLLETRLRPVQRGYERAHRWASNRWANDLVVQRIAKSRYLRDTYSEFIARGEDPRRAYSIAALIKSFFK